jgi:hypothetical protein
MVFSISAKTERAEKKVEKNISNQFSESLIS